MADHRWDTSPSAPRLSRSRTPASVEEPGTAAGEYGDGAAPDNEWGGAPPERQRRRWLISFRASVLAVCLLAGAVAGLVVFKGGGLPAEVTSVDLDPAPSASPAGDGSGSGTGVGANPGDDNPSDHIQDQDHNQGQGNSRDSGPDQGSGTGAPGEPAGPSVLVVHVAGAVTSPGVVRIPSGSRAGDAVEAAGGAVPEADLTAVNLAAPLQDGAMVIVPRVGEQAPAPADGGAGTGAVSGADTGTGAAGGSGAASGTGAGPGSGAQALVNINTASVQDLDALPRVGPVIAERIIAWRSEHGRFARPEDIDAVPGIGEAMLAALLPLITV
ncbi:helix-hairpin-helix domain-containing protein [Arthrobacter sp. G119Y2]|uniref:helix-hairpin-helix domain-containing protein n=1 Tax=Arthrobacter sp. G119Y2 TaxID=3134965 RepID=UPI0031193F40